MEQCEAHAASDWAWGQWAGSYMAATFCTRYSPYLRQKEAWSSVRGTCMTVRQLHVSYLLFYQLLTVLAHDAGQVQLVCHLG